MYSFVLLTPHVVDGPPEFLLVDNGGGRSMRFISSSEGGDKGSKKVFT